MDMQAKDYLLRIPFWTKKKNSLEQVGEILKELGDPERRLRILHVAGTNGKGSVCADLTSILMEAGYRVGTFISPHLVDIRERFLLNGEMVGEEDFQSVFEQVLAVVQKPDYCHPTYFEFVFLMAMVLFDRKKVDFAILETGLGGRLDTTNVVRRPIACVITSISLDHTQYLGDTIPQIASEKAGIIKENVPVIYDDCDPEASAVIRERAVQRKAAAWPVGESVLAGPRAVPENGEGRTGDLSGDTKDEEIRRILKEVPFAAPYQVRNAALALRTLQVLQIEGVTEAACREGLKKVRWPGRMEEAAPGVWLDGAHNPGGIRAFIQAVRAQQTEPFRIHLLFAAVSDKDYREMIHLLCEDLSPDRVTVVHLQSERGLGAGSLAEIFRRAGCRQVEAYETAGAALAAALKHKTEGDRLYVVGSLYLIGEIKEYLRRNGDAGL